MGGTHLDPQGVTDLVDPLGGFESSTKGFECAFNVHTGGRIIELDYFHFLEFFSPSVILR